MIARIILLPFYGRALLQAPLLAAQLLYDSDYVAGLPGKMDREARHLILTFTNEAVAQQFHDLNESRLK